MAELIRFSNKAGGEYVVIVTDNGDPRDHCKPGYAPIQAVEIGPDREFVMFPCDTPLTPDE